MFQQMCKTMMYLSIPCFVMTSCQTSTSHQSSVGLDKELTTISGKLDNGLTYYIKENSYDEKKASLRLAVKVGSVLEQEDERGLAHFLEHMVFRGTQSYSDGEVIDYLESIGASFGADTNAYTSYDETVYMLEIPLEKEGSLEKAISILSEFSMKALLPQEQLEVEKNVVLEELRIRTNTAAGRINNKLTELLFQGTLYGERNPIGLEEVVKNCTPEKIRNFYTKWYRPENMALIVVGDICREEVIAYMQRYFGTLPVSEQVVEIVRPNLADVNHQYVKVHKDPENIRSYFLLGSWIKNNPLFTIEDVKEHLLDQLIIEMANRRFYMKSQEESSPFQQVAMMSMKIISPATCFLQQCICWDQEPAQALEAVILESTKMQRHDFTSSELEIALSTHKNTCKMALDNALKHKNTEYATSYLMHFMSRGSALSFEESAQISLNLLDQIELDEINTRKNILLQKRGQVVIFCPSAKAPELSEEQITDLIVQGASRSFELEIDKEQPELLLSTHYSPGFTVKTEVFEKTGVKRIVLSNGMVVYLEKTDLKENLFSIGLKARGGASSYEESLYPSALVAFTYLQKSGLAGLSNVELQDALAGKHAQLGYQMTLNSREITGEGSNEDMEVLFKLIHALFTDRMYRGEAWNQCMKTVDQMFELVEHSPEMKFQRDVNQFDYNNHYCVNNYNSQSMSKEDAETILAEAFRDLSEYVLTVVGDYNEEQLRSCLERYLASIPVSSARFPSQVVTHFEFPSGVNHRNMHYDAVGRECSVYWVCPINASELSGNYKDCYQIDLAEHIIQTRLLKKLRVEVGETYGVRCMTYCPFAPQMTSGKTLIMFSAAPEVVEKMNNILFEEIQKIHQVSPTVEEIHSAQEIYKHQQLKALQTNAGRVERILEQLEFGSQPDEFLTEEHHEVTQDSLHKVMKSLLNLTNYSLHTKLAV